MFVPLIFILIFVFSIAFASDPYGEKSCAIPLSIAGLMLVFITTFTLPNNIQARGATIVSEKVIEYEIISLQTDVESTIYSPTGSRYDLEILEEKIYHICYKLGEEQAFKTINSKEVTFTPYCDSIPMLRETTTSYEYHYTGFEKFWFGGYCTGLTPYTQTTYEIYAPENFNYENIESS